MGLVHRTFRRFAWFRRAQQGATAVEFVILLPIMMVTFGAIVEASRIYWNYQAAVSGVRDASRYLARITNNDVCSGGTAPANATTLARNIVERSINSLNIDSTTTTAIFPSAVSLDATTPVTTAYNCISVTGVTGNVPVVRVNANLQIQLPFGTVFEFFGSRATTVLTSTITDQSRVYGL